MTGTSNRTPIGTTSQATKPLYRTIKTAAREGSIPREKIAAAVKKVKDAKSRHERQDDEAD